ncbi:MAG: hypothetical protein M1828_001032 [Chrysothrix sp. TS-e1954]|nr:MAG: hypothetical protein M1828_001032 [Chrysothrix sp. TS-e1954]
MSLGGQGAYIYTGPWIDYSQGVVWGSTITLSPRDAQVLGSFLAAYVTVVGSQLWKIITFAAHQFRAHRGPSDGIHHQQQVILRNSASPSGAALSFFQQAWYWRGTARRSFLRTVPWGLCAIAYVMVFAVLSVFTSSQVTTSHSATRLVRSPRCGQLSLAGGEAGGVPAFSIRNLNSSLLASSYARVCYASGDAASNLQCGVYVRPNLPWTANAAAACPFEDGTCLGEPNTSFEMKSDLIDSLHDLGINTPEHDRLQYRKTAVCSVLHTKQFAQNVTVESEAQQIATARIGDDVFLYDYGPSALVNYTYAYNLNLQTDGVPYTAVGYLSVLGSETGWQPMPALNRTDADVSITFISSNSLTYDYPCQDPVFNTSASYTPPPTPGVSATTFYYVEQVVSPIACTDQHQFCNPNTGVCSTPTGAFRLPEAVESLGLSLTQQVVFTRIFGTALSSDLYYSTFGRGGSALRASETVNDEVQTAQLANNQWTLEVSSWFETSLARLQQGILSYATGPPNVPDSEIRKPQNVLEEAQCYSQKVALKNGTVSFSVLGMSIVLIVGAIIILFSAIQEEVVGFVQRRLMGKGASWRNLNWVLDDKLQLQRMLFESLGWAGEWRNERGSIPVNEAGGRFGGWDDVDDGNPRLGRAGLTMGGIGMGQGQGQGEESPFMQDEKGRSHVNVGEVQ